MSPDAFADRLLDLAYGELPRDEAREVEAHAASCEACRAELARIRETRRLMSALPEEPAPEEGERALFAAAREAAERRAPRHRARPWFWGATLVAASLVAVGAVSYRILALRPGPLEPDDREALLGSSPYAAAPEAPPARTEGADRAAPPAEDVPAQAARPAPPAPASRAARPQRAPADARSAAAKRPDGAERPAGADGEGGAQRRAERPPRAFAEPPPPVADAQPPAAEARSPAQKGEGGLLGAPAAPAQAPAVEREGQPVRGGARAAAEAGRAAEAAGRSTPLAFSAPFHAEVRTFPGCDGESTRRVETDARGRVARYVREGTVAGRRVRIVHVFRPDGALESATAQDLDAAAAPLDARALGVAVPERAEEARSDAPPRCGR